MDDLAGKVVFFGGIFFFGGLVALLIRFFFSSARTPDAPSTEIEPPPLRQRPPSISEVDVRQLLGEAQPESRPSPHLLGGAPKSAEEVWYDPDPRRIAIRAAIQNHWRMSIVYHDNRGDRTERIIEPESTDGERVAAFCHLRQETRHFRYDRIESIDVLAKQERSRTKYRVSAFD